MHPERRRHGVALVAALALLTLAAALIVGASTLARASSRSSRTYFAAFTADAEARRALASFLAGWPAEADTLSVGHVVVRETNGSAGGDVAARTAVRLTRLSPLTYALSADCRVGGWASPVARRRLRLLLRRPVARDTLELPSIPRPIARWPLSESY